MMPNLAQGHGLGPGDGCQILAIARNASDDRIYWSIRASSSLSLGLSRMPTPDGYIFLNPGVRQIRFIAFSFSRTGDPLGIFHQGKTTVEDDKASRYEVFYVFSLSALEKVDDFSNCQHGFNPPTERTSSSVGPVTVT
jgi:hypothetical protein